MIAAAGVAVLRFVSAGIDGELLDRLDRRRVGSDPAFRERAAGVGGYAVERGAVGGRLAAADHEAVIAAEVFRIGREGGEIERRAHGSADHQRQIVHQLVLERDAGFGIFGLQLNGGRLDLDRLRGRADLQRRIGAHGLRGVQIEPALQTAGSRIFRRARYRCLATGWAR